ncbi:glycosyltransferase [Shewanella goraebulensis]|uniref:glycosyltransferase n=1 Tax=Shewanella goraebulensis TaxID=3050637 RepID=UPI0025501081|nr:glycosyltransferase [Shewanella goraebulensis]
MEKRNLKDDNFIVQNSHELPRNIFSVCGMSVYKMDKLNWVEQAVNSILTQTLSPSLFVIVIDGDVDENISLYLNNIERKNKHVILIHGLKNLGLSTCMNFIIGWTLPLNPTYFFRMDSDDISIPHRFEKQIQLLEKHKDIDVLGSALWEIDADGNKLGMRCLPTKHTVLIKSLSRRCPINHPTVVMRYTIFEKGFRYLKDMRNTEDYFFWITLAHAGFKFANIREPLLNFRRLGYFYERRGRSLSINEFRARLLAMKLLNQRSARNYLYANVVLVLRFMPAPIIKLAYKIDRFLLKTIIGHD